MSRGYLHPAWGIGVLALMVSSCSGQPGSPALQPLLAAAPEAKAVILQGPLSVGLVWVRPSEGAVTIPERSERATVETIRSRFPQGGNKMLRVVRVDTVSSVDLAAFRQLGQAHGLRHALVVAPTVREVEVPVYLRTDSSRSSGSPGTRTESYVILEAVGIALDTGSSLFSARGNGAAALEELDSGPFGPWFPRMTRGGSRGGSGPVIYPDDQEFPPDEVRDLALKDALASLLAALGRLGNP